MDSYLNDILMLGGYVSDRLLLRSCLGTDLINQSKYLVLAAWYCSGAFLYKKNGGLGVWGTKGLFPFW